jgi:pyruvyltransferase
MIKLKEGIKLFVFSIWYFILRKIYREDVVFLDCRPLKNNFGDEFNLWMVAELSGKRVVQVQSEYFFGRHMMAAGSIIDHARPQTIVWGSGLIAEDKPFCEKICDIRAVRGRLTRRKLLEKGVICPEVFGDPALLIPRLYPQSTKHEKKFTYGVIPHYVDKQHVWVKDLAKRLDVKIIDIQNPSIFSFIDDVLSCEIIVSSSLHGLILADAYNIPNVWIKLTSGVIGGEFKFMDYYSIGKRVPNCISIKGEELIVEIGAQAEVTHFEIDLNDLWGSFPYKKSS